MDDDDDDDDDDDAGEGSISVGAQQSVIQSPAPPVGGGTQSRTASSPCPQVK